MSSPTMPVRRMGQTLPRPIGSLLGRLDRQVRVSSLVRGVGTTAVVAALVVAAGMIADFLWTLPQAFRWGTWVAAVGAAGAALGASVIWPVVRRRSAFELAAAAERGRPGMQEHLTGAVALLESPSTAHGSRSLIAAVVERAAEEVRQVDPAAVVPWRRGFKRLAFGTGAIALLLAPLLLWPEGYGRLARHFLMPWSDVERPGRFQIAVSPGEKAVAVGADLPILATVRARLALDRVPSEAWLEWAAEGEQAIHRVPMPAASTTETRQDGTGRPASPASEAAAPAESATKATSAREFAITLPRLAKSIWYRVESGRVKSPRYAVTVLEPPAVTAIEARVEPPAYTKLPASVVAAPFRIEAFEGSKVTLKIEASRPVQSIEVSWPVESAVSTSESAHPERFSASLEASGRRGVVEVEAVRSGPFAVSLADSIGIASGPDEPRRVVVRADLPPVVAVRGPDGVHDASPKDTLSVAIAARDDIAVASVELHYTIERADSSSAEPETRHIDAAPTGIGSRAARGLAALALSRLGLKPGDSLSYRVRVADNRPAPRGPNVVWSEQRTLSIVAAATPIAARASRARSSALRSKLESIKKEVIADREKTEHLRQAADAARRGDGPWDEPQRQRLRSERRPRGRSKRI